MWTSWRLRSRAICLWSQAGRAPMYASLITQQYLEVHVKSATSIVADIINSWEAPTQFCKAGTFHNEVNSYAYWFSGDSLQFLFSCSGTSMTIEIKEKNQFCTVAFGNNDISGGTFYAIKHVDSWLSLGYTETSCPSGVHASLKCILMTTDCQGVWVADGDNGDIGCGLCSCATGFTHTALSLGNLCLTLNTVLHLSIKAFTLLP